MAAAKRRSVAPGASERSASVPSLTGRAAGDLVRVPLDAPHSERCVRLPLAESAQCLLYGTLHALLTIASQLVQGTLNIRVPVW